MMSEAIMGRRRVLTATQWQALFERFNASGESVTAFCRRQAVSPSSFYRWRRKLGSAPAEASEAPPTFIDAGALAEPAASPANAAWAVELALGNGVVLRLRR